jgi:hypothetical protein
MLPLQVLHKQLLLHHMFKKLRMSPKKFRMIPKKFITMMMILIRNTITMILNKKLHLLVQVLKKVLVTKSLKKN